MATERFTVYYFPASYCSQKVLIALKEKKASYSKRLVNLFELEHTEAWFMRINPLGEVPVLQDGDKYIRDSEDIIDYIDQEIPGDIKLVPDPETELGQQVAQTRKMLYDVPFEMLTFGTIFHPDLVPQSDQKDEDEAVERTESQEFKDRTEDSLTKMSSMADSFPDLHDAYMIKSRTTAEKLEAMQNKDKVQDVLNEVDAIFEKIEEQLREIKTTNGEDSWMCGPEFTAADIGLAVLLGRIRFLGLEGMFFPHWKRPNIQSYWENKVKTRETLWTEIESARKYMLKHYIKKKAKQILPYAGAVSTAGFAIGMAAYLFNKYVVEGFDQKGAKCSAGRFA